MKLSLHVLRYSIVIAALVIPLKSFADDPDEATREDTIKAAFVLNFVRLTEWPDTISEIEICHAARPELGHAVELLNGTSAGGHPIRVKSLFAADANLSSCQVLLVDGSLTDPDLLRIALPLSAAHMLTISDGPPPGSFVPTITLRRFGPRIRFEVDLESARNADLKLSSKLLRLAVQVKG